MQALADCRYKIYSASTVNANWAHIKALLWLLEEEWHNAIVSGRAAEDIVYIFAVTTVCVHVVGLHKIFMALFVYS